MGKKENHNRKRYWVKKLLRLSTIIVACFVGLTIVTTLLFYIYRDTIGREILLRANDYQRGKFSFSELAFTPFVHFPSISLRLEDIVYYQNSPQYSVNSTDTIATLEKLYIAIDLMDLLRSDVNVSKLTITNGTVYLRMRPDSTLNLLQAIKSRDSDLILSDSLQGVEENDTASTTNTSVLLESIYLNNIKIQYLNSFEKDTISAEFTSLTASLDYQAGIVKGNLVVDSKINKLIIFSDKPLRDLALRMNTSFSYDEKLKKANISQGNLQVADASFQLDGYSVFSDDLEVDLSLSGQDENLSIFGFWLSETGLKNVRAGSPYFNGTIKGSFNESLPSMNFDFGMKDVNLYLPSVNHNISDLNFEGTFSSGTKTDFSMATLAVKNLSGKMPGGYLNANLEIKDFTQPEISLLWDMDADIDGFDEIFNISGVQGLRGHISIHDKFIGQYDISSASFSEEVGESSILLDSIAIDLPGFIDFRNICGELHRSMDTLIIDSLSLMAGNSDFIIAGELRNWFSLLDQTDEDILADLHIVSDTFDLPNFCSFDPRVGESFPYRIIDVDIDLKAKTNRQKLLDFVGNPEILFTINSLDATIEKLFPPVEIYTGEFLLTEKDGRVYLTFDDFELAMAESNIKADVIFSSPRNDPDMVDVDAAIRNFNPGKILLSGQDSLAGFADGILQGEMSTQLNLGMDSLVFESLSFDAKTLDYTTLKDTIAITNLSMKGDKIHYLNGDNPLASLSGEINLLADKINSNHFQVEDIHYDIHAQEGTYTIHPEKVRFFGKEGEGVYVLRPFSEKQSYELKYKVTGFNAEKFLASIMADTLIFGALNLDLDVSLSDFEEDSILAGLNGYLNLNGEDLIFYGMDVDQLINRFQRSQNFNLVDVGAVVLAGPIGLAVTKGADFTNLVIGSYKDSTKVTQIVSEWNCENGKLIMSDVAFSTEENRIACIGWIDLNTNTLDITFAVLDKNGCSILSQSISGPVEDPEYGEIKVVSALLGPVTNLIDGALGKDCEVFYSGKLKPLPKKKKNKT